MRLVSNPGLFELVEMHELFCHYCIHCIETLETALLENLKKKEYDFRRRMENFYRLWILIRGKNHHPARPWDIVLMNNMKVNPQTKVKPGLHVVHNLFNGGYHLCHLWEQETVDHLRLMERVSIIFDRDSVTLFIHDFLIMLDRQIIFRKGNTK
jgi:hypothetical protein